MKNYVNTSNMAEDVNKGNDLKINVIALSNLKYHYKCD